MKRSFACLVYPLSVIIMTFLLVAGCSDDKPEPVKPPTVTTLDVIEISQTSAKSGGNVADDGGGEVTARGIVWSSDENPTLENHSGLTIDGTGTGQFISHITDLSPAATYFVRAYATNSSGTSYGNEVMFETIPITYILTLEVNPPEAGVVTGAGAYQEDQTVEITASAGEYWVFVNWTGDTDYIDDMNQEETTVSMPAYDISLTANFKENNIVYGDGVSDIDGNEYITVIIGDHEWMAENLRVTRYRNGDPVSTGLSNIEWANTTDGAYAIYPHDDIPNIGSPQEMVSAYGKLYNWYAVDDPRGLCPEGWRVPGAEEWTELVSFIESKGFPNEWNNPVSTGNALKSCRKINSPFGADCNTFQHPRWNSYYTHHGFDEFGFAALPAGLRYPDGVSGNIGNYSTWWTSDEEMSIRALSMSIFHTSSLLYKYISLKKCGYSIRCVREN